MLIANQLLLDLPSQFERTDAVASTDSCFELGEECRGRGNLRAG